MVEARGGSRFASAVFGDPNALRFGTRLRTIRLKNDPPDHFSSRRMPSQGSTPPQRKRRQSLAGPPSFLVEAARNHPFSRHFYMDIEAIPGIRGVDSKESHSLL